jgi:hypothetical protein
VYLLLKHAHKLFNALVLSWACLGKPITNYSAFQQIQKRHVGAQLGILQQNNYATPLILADAAEEARKLRVVCSALRVTTRVGRALISLFSFAHIDCANKHLLVFVLRAVVNFLSCPSVDIAMSKRDEVFFCKTITRQDRLGTDIRKTLKAVRSD